MRQSRFTAEQIIAILAEAGARHEDGGGLPQSRDQPEYVL